MANLRKEPLVLECRLIDKARLSTRDELEVAAIQVNSSGSFVNTALSAPKNAGLVKERLVSIICEASFLVRHRPLEWRLELQDTLVLKTILSGVVFWGMGFGPSQSVLLKSVKLSSSAGTRIIFCNVKKPN